MGTFSNECVGSVPANAWNFKSAFAPFIGAGVCVFILMRHNTSRLSIFGEGNMELECVFVGQGLLQAEVAKSKLEAFGIPAILQYESVGPIYGLTVDGLGQVKVMVPADLADKARRLLNEEHPDADDTA
ncbi:MAG: hypothetical protein D6802_05245 [Ardenticatenia bacterium]|nr:MAG: hypothetical protein D6802_05245 [Ardenticatenia bacterium]